MNERADVFSIRKIAGFGRRAIGPTLQRRVRVAPEHPIALELVLGTLAACVAVGVRWCLPLGPQQLPTITVVITLAIMTMFVGPKAGVVTALVGGVLSWYLFFNPHSWSLANQAWVPLLGFGVIATVIVSTATLYRQSEQRSHSRELAALADQAATSELFAREMAHRLKNALAIVQSIAFQTFGKDTPEAILFGARLKTLADANELLTEQVNEPDANVGRVVRAALQPFNLSSTALAIECADARIPARQVISLALALHELATNAVKYGALSTPSGRVSLRLEDVGEMLNFTWKEQGGPLVARPKNEGFGTRLLRRTGMSTQLFFEADGLRCSFALRKA